MSLLLQSPQSFNFAKVALFGSSPTTEGLQALSRPNVGDTSDGHVRVNRGPRIQKSFGRDWNIFYSRYIATTPSLTLPNYYRSDFRSLTAYYILFYALHFPTRWGSSIFIKWIGKVLLMSHCSFPVKTYTAGIDLKGTQCMSNVQLYPAHTNLQPQSHLVLSHPC